MKNISEDERGIKLVTESSSLNSIFIQTKQQRCQRIQRTSHKFQKVHKKTKQIDNWRADFWASLIKFARTEEHANKTSQGLHFYKMVDLFLLLKTQLVYGI